MPYLHLAISAALGAMVGTILTLAVLFTVLPGLGDCALSGVVAMGTRG